MTIPSMGSILTILSFPIPCMAIWNWDHGAGSPLVFCQDSGPKSTCEVALPKLWLALSDFHQSIRIIATLTAPGPFTAVRAGMAFAQGLVSGDDRWSVFSTSLFALMPEDKRSAMLLDTGGHHWVDQQGTIRPPDSVGADCRISSATCTENDRIQWSLNLAGMAAAV